MGLQPFKYSPDLLGHMADQEYTIHRSSGMGRYQIAAALAGAGLVLMFWALQFQSERFLTSSPIESRGSSYSRVWIDSSDMPVGAKIEGSRLTIERWSGLTWHVDFPANIPAWSVSPDFSRVVWIENGKVHMASQDGLRLNMDLKGNDALRAGALSDGSVAAVFRNGAVARWDKRGAAVEALRTGLNSADQAVIENDYAAIASYATQTVSLYRFEGGDWKLVQQEKAPDPPFDLILPGKGVVAELASGAVRIGEQIRNAPGATLAASANELDLIATGDYEGVWVLPPQSDHYRLAEARAGSVVAASRSRIAVSGPDGTALFSLAGANRLTAAGRGLSSVALLLFTVASLLAFSGLILSVFTGAFKGRTVRVRDKRVPLTLGEPPSGLVKAVRGDACILWAGAGLGAQAGFPTRQAFAAMLMQTVQIEGWVPAQIAQKLQSMCARGKAEEAISELVRIAPEQRGKIVDFLKSTYARFAVPSRTHDLLKKMSFQAAITTNYDTLLEQARDKWSENTLTLNDPPKKKDYIIKLYGNVREPRTLLLSRVEFDAAMATSNTALTLAQVLETKTVMFIGCSIEGLLADLNRLNIGQTPTSTHFALVGVSSAGWTGAAEQLSRRYGIELLACAEEKMGQALPAFLERLAENVKELESGESVAAQAGSN